MRDLYNKLWLLVMALLISANSFGSDVIEVIPLTNRIIMLRFDDGYIRHHRKGEARANEWAVHTPLNVSVADLLNAYSITSADDPDYQGLVFPASVGRKTKGTDFSWLCQAWDPSTGCVNTSDDHTKEHWVYLVLNAALKNGSTYTINLADELNVSSASVSFTYDDKISRSEAVHVNIIGYAPAAEKKYGYVYHWMGSKGGLDLSSYAGAEFWLINTNTNAIAFTGNVAFRKPADNPETGQTSDTPNANFLGAEVYECDFSSFTTPGEYRLAVQGIGASFPFVIDDNAYADPYKTIIRSLYHQRSGIELRQPYTAYTRPAPHNPNITPGFAGKIKYTSSRFIDWVNQDHSSEDLSAIESGIKGDINTWGWYQDAGDWDGYFSHMRIPAMLSFLYEFAPGKYPDNQLNLPESGNGVPDLIDEAAWLPRYFHRTRHAIMEAGYGTGGVGARVAGDWFGSDGEGVPSYEDVNRTYIVSGEDPYSTFMYAANAAHLAIILQKAGVADPDGVNWLGEATEAYAWAIAHTLSGDDNKSGLVLKHIRLYAAAALYKLTGMAAYHEQFKLDAADILGGTALAEDQRWGVYTYLTMGAGRPVEPALYQKLKDAAITAADNVAANYVNTRAARYGGNYWFPMLIGQATTPQVFEGIAGYFITRDSHPAKAQTYLANIYTTADYFLGNNPLNMAWATGLGERHPNHVFHMDSWYNGRDNDGNNNEEEFYPGIVPYGPWRKEGDAQGPWDPDWAGRTTYPAYDTWPGHERWFDLRTAPTTAEFTVHQNTVLAAVTYGFLTNGPEGNNPQPPTQLVVADFDEVIPTVQDVEPGRTQMFTSGGSATIVSNPASSEANSSTNVARYQKPEGTWKVLGFNMQSDNAVSGFQTFSFQLYGSNVTEVYVSLNAADGTKTLESFQAVNIRNSWETISLTIPDTLDRPVKDILIFLNPNNTAIDTFYVDNVKFSGGGSAIPVTGVTFSADSLTLALGESKQVFASVVPNNATLKNIIWNSSNPDVASVDYNGVIAALALGQSVITVTTADGAFTDSLTVTVTEKLVANSHIVADFDTVIPTINVVEPGRTQMFGSGTLAIVDNPYKNELNNSNTVVQYDREAGNWKLIGWNMQTGLPLQDFYSLSFQIYGTGITEIFVTLNDDTGTKITEGFKSVSVDNRWATVEWDLPLNSSLKIRDILVFPNPNSGGAATYWIDNVKLNSKAAPSAVTGIELTEMDTVAVGNSIKIMANVLPANATNQAVTWISRDSSTATVDANGNVKGVAEGNVYVVATTTEGGFADSTLVTVLPRPPVEPMILADFDTVIPTINDLEPGRTQMFGGGTLAYAANPAKDETNSSDQVMKFDREEGAWKLIGLNTQVPRDISAYTSLSLQFYATDITEAFITLKDSAGNTVAENFISVAAGDGWQTLSMDIPEDPSARVKDVLIFLNPNNANTATYYVDNIQFNGPVTSMAPTVTFTSPVPGEVIEAGSSIVLSANASDQDGIVNKVIFSLNDAVLVEDVDSPYSHTITMDTPGMYLLKATAIDDDGNEAIDTVRVTVEAKTLFTVGDCSFELEDFPADVAAIAGVNKVSYADFSTRKNSYVIGIAAGLRKDGNGGAWEIHNDCSIQPLRKSGSIANTSLLPEVAGLEARWGWHYEPAHISRNGKFIYANAVNEQGFIDSHYGEVIKPGTVIPVRFRMGPPKKGRISEVESRIECTNVRYRRIGKKYLAVACDDAAANSLEAMMGEDQRMSLYPNPSKGTVRIDIPVDTQVMIKIVDAVGKPVYNGLYDAGTELQLPLSAGLYNVIVYYGNGRVLDIQKLIIE